MVKDKLYFSSQEDQSYIPLTREIYQNILQGTKAKL
jgi:hypothetical protein